MRIISGRARGTKLYTIEGLDTRPTTDRVKESLFNLLQYDFYGKTVLDLYAGSGALGLEAASRGAVSVIAVDESRACVEVIKKNAEKTRFTAEVKVVQSDCLQAVARLPEASVDLIFMDPPYARGFVGLTLEKICSCNVIKPSGLIVVEHAKEDRWEVPEVLEVLKSRTYGITSLTIYRRKA